MLLVSCHQLSLSKYAYNWCMTLILSNLLSPSAKALVNFHLTFPPLDLIVGYTEILSSHLRSYSTVRDLTPVICVCFRSTADGQHHHCLLPLSVSFILMHILQSHRCTVSHNVLCLCVISVFCMSYLVCDAFQDA